MRQLIKKQVLVLANSVKRDSRCIAGREISQQENRIVAAGWIRPVSDHGEGEISALESRLPNGRQPQVLDVVEIPLIGPNPAPGQPENWQIVSGGRWSRVECTSPPAASLEERPEDLWLEKNERRTDRISVQVLKRKRSCPSLYLVRPKSLHIELYTEYNSYKGKDKPQRRAVFRYNGVQYDLPITDPVLQDRYYGKFPGVDEGKKVITSPFGDRCLLCVSLTPEFHGHHYKIVAAVIQI